MTITGEHLRPRQKSCGYDFGAGKRKLGLSGIKITASNARRFVYHKSPTEARLMRERLYDYFRKRCMYETCSDIQGDNLDEAPHSATGLSLSSSLALSRPHH